MQDSSGPLAKAVADLRDGFFAYRSWALLGWYEIKQRYRRSFLGPFWLSISTAVMAALTNVAGFGTVGLSNYPGLASMGIVSAIGSITCLITALTTLPALMILTRTRVTVHRA